MLQCVAKFEYKEWYFARHIQMFFFALKKDLELVIFYIYLQRQQFDFVLSIYCNNLQRLYQDKGAKGADRKSVV